MICFIANGFCLKITTLVPANFKYYFFIMHPFARYLLQYILFSGFFLAFTVLKISANCPDNSDSTVLNKRFTDVCWLTTHNAYNYAPAFKLPNQNNDIATQLANGVRSFMLDVYPTDTGLVLYHGISFFGAEKFVPILTTLRGFLIENPVAILTLHLENYASPKQIEAALFEADLLKYIYIPPDGQKWPFIADMVAANTRLVVFIEGEADPKVPVLLHEWNFVVETPFSIHQLNEFDCSFNRGEPQNDLFLINHFVTDAISGIGMPDSALLANETVFLANRINECWLQTGKFPNFVALDFYDLTDAKTVICQLNQLNTGLKPNFSTTKSVKIQANFYADVLNWQCTNLNPDYLNNPVVVQVFNTSGCLMAQSKIYLQKNNSLHFKKSLPLGYYYAVLSSGINKFSQRFPFVVTATF